MRTLLLAFLLPLFPVVASEASRKAYLELLESHPNAFKPHGSAEQGEIEIVLDPEKMALIEQETGRDIGVIARDKYWIWVNDPCLFPNSREGVYGRILWAASPEGTPGAAVIAIRADGKIALNCNFRHATRSWEIELPRGGVNPGEDLQEAAKREVMEETGMLVDSLVELGRMPPDSGLTNSAIPIFLAHIVGERKAAPEGSEAIEEILFLSLDEIREAFARGYYMCNIRGVQKPVLLRDPFLAYAVLVYSERLSFSGD